ncbi:MAG TPA: flavocytochrome c [Eubacteriaceae bacterium]|nr:flavocytochrome c [Eubacteriaceae bacterium]
MVFAFGCRSNSETDGQAAYEAGTYEGVGEGINGEIKLEVEVSSDKIESINVVEHEESPGISDPAFDQIPQSIIDDQTLAVDIVSGATYSSEGIIEAVTQALTAAGGDIEALTAKDTTEKAKEMEEITTDVVVIGAGGAGLSAAVSAHENGAEVLVLEKMGKAGGNTVISGASYNAVDPGRQEAQGIEDSVDLHFEQTYEGGDELGDQDLIRILVENAYPTIEWLEEKGMEFNDHIHTVLGGLWPRAHSPVKPLGTGFIETYMNYIDGTNGEAKVMLNTEATELIMDGNKVVGVKAEGKDALYEITASKGVIVASGGFGASVDLRNEYNEHWADLTDIPTTNHPGATGDGIVMAKEVGADLKGMEWIQLLPMGDPETGSLSGNIEQGVENRIFVNKAGNRFVDEGARRDVMTQALFEQEDNLMWVVLDKHSYPTEDVKNHFNESIEELVEAGRAYRADTLEELAEQIGVDPDNLVEAVEKFNAAVDGGTDEFGRTLFEDKIDSPPYYAGARVPTVHHTMGGIAINTETQVLAEDGSVIENLYAAGEVTGGIHGSNRLGGNALADINVFGRIAGENAATK